MRWINAIGICLNSLLAIFFDLCVLCGLICSRSGRSLATKSTREKISRKNPFHVLPPSQRFSGLQSSCLSSARIRVIRGPFNSCNSRDSWLFFLFAAIRPRRVFRGQFCLQFLCLLVFQSCGFADEFHLSSDD